jgi:hypothetical protein
LGGARRHRAPVVSDPQHRKILVLFGRLLVVVGAALSGFYVLLPALAGLERTWRRDSEGFALANRHVLAHGPHGRVRPGPELAARRASRVRSALAAAPRRRGG